MSLSLESVLPREQPIFVTPLELLARFCHPGLWPLSCYSTRGHMMRIIVPLFILAALIPIPASAITIQEVIALSQAGVSDDVVVALIEQDSTIFSVDASQAIALKREGVSERVVLAMLRSGRQTPPPGPSAAPEMPPAVPTEPSLLVVGHGPDRPNTYHSFDSVEGFPPAVVYTVPYAPFVPGISKGCHTNGWTSSGQRTVATKTAGLHQAAEQFVNSTLLPMLNQTEGVAPDCPQS